ncbi:uncharacterized protein LOC109831084 [Asparagus officinalis]|uniref:uncharacterized protein LOC109831084 n=1 Tax=Asparagus officinalis TaxID=4686 RepID=UPI00098DF504|nr:uncharacterized protein LOC109831084 [Asparagus officinalis]
MARNSNLRSNRGSRTSQLVSKQIMLESEAAADDAMADPKEAAQEEATTEERLVKVEEAIVQQGFFTRQLSARVEELSSQLTTQLTSQFQNLVQELKQSKEQSKEPGQEIPRSGARDERRMSGLDPRNDTSFLGPGSRGMNRQDPEQTTRAFQPTRGVDSNGERQPVYNLGNVPHKNSFFSNQKLVQPKSLRLDFPSFSGNENVIAWLEQVEQIFEYYDIKGDEWVKVCSFYLREEALQWYRWLARNLEEFFQWEIFKEEIITRFGPSELSRPYDAFSTLKQTNTVRDYLGRFEQTLSLLDDQPSRRHILEKFIGGLKEELRYEVTASRPSSLKEAISLAKLFEDRLKNERKSRGNWNTSNTGMLPTNSSPYPSVRENPKPPSQFKKLTPEDIQRRRSQNLCFTCDEKWFRGHQCKGKQMFLLEGILKGDSEENEVENGEEGEEDITIELAESLVKGAPSISVQALSGVNASHTIRVVGYYKNQAVSILIDSGSTHNFINSKLLGLVVTESNSFDVLVASGELIKGGGVCQAVSLECQGVRIQVDLLVMPVGGSQIVLGADWMKTLEDITLNFKKLQVTFFSDGAKRTLQGVLPEELQLVDSKAISKTFREQKQELPHLPPSRSIDHKIPLEGGTKPICIRPYRHAHFLKDEIEKQVEEMLKKGIIRPSNSPFSSPVVMVKKSDGNWRMCIDYRSLNQSTIKDKFPIPVIDELLDELHGTKYFTKLDLKSGYHQIRMYEPDIPKTAFRTHSGHYEFLVMPFGLTNAPSTFQSLMNTIFKDFLRKFILVFFDDILVYSKGWHDHLSHLRQVFQIMRNYKLVAKMSKCSFGQTQVKYLGHIVSQDGVGLDPRKIEAIVDWPRPKTLKGLRGFLGLAGYYRKFIKNFGFIAQSLTQLLKKGAFGWGENAEKAFEASLDTVVEERSLWLGGKC